MRSSCALVVMARYPAVGAVKTRLARAIGAERACALYRAFLGDIAARFDGRRRPLIWSFHPPYAHFSSVVAPGGRCLPQRGASLGQRLYHCFRVLHAEGFARVIVIGADVPHVRDAWLDEAEASLDRADVVLGPAADGGYYLAAMREPHDIFTGIRMSTDRVLADTMRTAQRARLRVHLLPRSFDVDEVEDLARLARLLKRTEWKRRLPETAAALAGWASV